MGGILAPFAWFAILIGMPAVILTLLYAGVWEVGRKYRRSHTPDCGAEHPESLYRDGIRVYSLDDSCKLPRGHAGPHRDRSSSGTTHKWEDGYCSYYTCCRCQARHVVGDKTFQCSQMPNHSASIRRGGGCRRHVVTDECPCDQR
jgi:hypothetical protein